jgi:hypothetical protein
MNIRGKMAHEHGHIPKSFDDFSSSKLKLRLEIFWQNLYRA